ncbi:MAG TPA: cytochrome C oxidase subunit IV family protein [Blastocatellia bacterium]|nr:cytochrome C oxidase subunit IV family protein [Blastocatellia bacterium]
MPEKIVSIKTSALVFASLLALTATTCAVAFIDLGRMNTVAALAIAFGKASLVALFFMHLRYSRRLIQVVAAVGLIWLGIMIALTMADFLTRRSP